MIIPFTKISPVWTTGPSQWRLRVMSMTAICFCRPRLSPSCAIPKLADRKRGQRDLQPRQKPDSTLSNT